MSEQPLLLPAESLGALRVEPVVTLYGHTERVWCVAWCPTANVLASCSEDSKVRIWGQDGQGTWRCITTLEGEHTRTVRHISWSPSGTYLACASFDHTASVWQRTSDDGFEFDIEGILDGHESELKCVEWVSETTLLTCARDHTIWVWDRIDDGEYECGGVLTGHSQDVKYCFWYVPTRDGERPLAISCSYDDTIRVWSDVSVRQDDWHCVQTLRTHEGTVWAGGVQKLELSLKAAEEAETAQSLLPQPLLCTCSDDLNVIFFKRDAEGKFVPVARSSGFCERAIYSLDWAPGSAPVVACASGDNSIALLGLHQDGEGVHVSQLARVADSHPADVNGVAFAHSGTLTVAAGASGTCEAQRGVLLASASDDCTVRLWRVVPADV